MLHVEAVAAFITGAVAWILILVGQGASALITAIAFTL